MLVQLADGRSFGFPDDMDEVQVDRFIQALLAAEKSAADAQRRVADLHAVVSAQKPPADNSAAVVAAIQEMRRELAAGLDRVAAICAADRILIEDELGVSRSRIAR